MAGRVGMEYGQMQQLKGKLDQEASAVRELRGRLDSQVNQIIGSGWQGQAATNFQTAWNTEFKNALDRLADALGEAGNEVNARMEAMQRADGTA